MKKKVHLFVFMSIFSFLICIFSFESAAQFYPFWGRTSPLLSPSYLSMYLNPYYYNTLAPISSFGQFDPSINVDEVDLSLEILYSPTTLRTYDPGSLQGLYNFSPSPFNNF